MPVDTFIAYVGVYADEETADADYEAVKDLHTEAGLMDAYDAAVIVRRDDGKVKITKKHETPRAGGVLGGGSGWPPAWSSPCSPCRHRCRRPRRRRRGRCSAPSPATLPAA